MQCSAFKIPKKKNLWLSQYPNLNLTIIKLNSCCSVYNVVYNSKQTMEVHFFVDFECKIMQYNFTS